MFRLASAHAPVAVNLTHTARTMANSVSPFPELKSRCMEARSAAVDRPWAHAQFDDLGVASRVTPLARELLPPQASDVAIKDWEVLFCAVKERLRLSVDDHLGATPGSRSQETADRVRTSVLECVEALDQLHKTQQQELSRRQRLELEIFDTRTALVQSRAELAGTQVQEKRARHLAQHDSLTSLPNRGLFGERLNQALTDAKRPRQSLAVLYLDLDGFKPVNDTYGHAIGDELLQIVAGRLTQTLRCEDVVSRLGGDEFACLLRDFPNQEQLRHLACKLFDAVSAPVKIGPLKLTVRPSIGIATCPAEGATADSLLKNADAAMYRAKRQQIGYAFYEASADAWAHEVEELSNS